MRKTQSFGYLPKSSLNCQFWSWFCQQHWRTKYLRSSSDKGVKGSLVHLRGFSNYCRPNVWTKDLTTALFKIDVSICPGNIYGLIHYTAREKSNSWFLQSTYTQVYSILLYTNAYLKMYTYLLECLYWFEFENLNF